MNSFRIIITPDEGGLFIHVFFGNTYNQLLQGETVDPSKVCVFHTERLFDALHIEFRKGKMIFTDMY